MTFQSSKPITALQAYIILMMSAGLLNHVILIPILLGESKRDAWITVLVSGGIYFLWIPLVYFIVKGLKGKSLVEWLYDHYGKLVTYFIVGLFQSLLLLSALITIYDTVNWTLTAYLTQTPKLVLLAALGIACFYCSYSGLKTIAISAGIFLPFVILLGWFVSITNFKYKEKHFLQPILANGWEPVWNGLIYPFSGLLELLLLVLIHHRLEKPFKVKGLYIMGLILIGLILGPLTGAIMEFGPAEAASLRYPAYEEWRLVRIGAYIEHLDFLSIYQWLSGAFIRISFSLYLIIELLHKPTKKMRLYWLGGAYAIVFLSSLYSFSDMTFLQLLKSSILPVITGILVFLSFAISVLLFVKRRRRSS